MTPKSGQHAVSKLAETIPSDWLRRLSAPKLALEAAVAACTLISGAGPVGAQEPVAASLSLSGTASWYGPTPAFHRRQAAGGERYDMHALTAAHRSLPFGTKVRVTNRRNGKSVVVRINDRGPYVDARVIDLSRGATDPVRLTEAGIAPVKLEVRPRRRCWPRSRTNATRPLRHARFQQQYPNTRETWRWRPKQIMSAGGTTLSHASRRSRPRRRSALTISGRAALRRPARERVRQEMATRRVAGTGRQVGGCHGGTGLEAKGATRMEAATGRRALGARRLTAAARPPAPAAAPCSGGRRWRRREQRLRIGVGRRAPGRPPLLHDLAEIHDGHAVADRPHHGEVVADEEITGQALA